MKHKQPVRGNSLLEFTLVCIPLIFVLVSLIELSRYMWSYHTLIFAVEKGARFAVVHGQGCAAASASCPVSVAAVARVIQNASTGLDSSQLSVVLQPASSAKSCLPLSSCLSNSDAWPPTADSGVGLPIKISASYPFRSALSVFWPGAGSVKTAAVNMGATVKEEVRF
jgi:Flp pilus assembly protein TadG